MVVLIKLINMGFKNSGYLIQSNYGTKGNFEVYFRSSCRFVTKMLPFFELKVDVQAHRVSVQFPDLYVILRKICYV